MGTDGRSTPSSASQEPQARPRTPEEQAFLEFDMWCKRVAMGLMGTLHGAVVRRAEALFAETGTRVTVVYPAQPPTDLACAASEVQFMKLLVGNLEVHLYSARNPGKPPILHLISAMEQLPPALLNSDGKVDFRLVKRRITSRPICRVAVPRDAVGYVLVEPHAQDKRVRADDIVARLFDEVMRRLQPGPASVR